MPGNLQDAFLAQCKREGINVTVTLMNGAVLRGVVTGFDPFTLFLEFGDESCLLYKHSIATIAPDTALHPDLPSQQ